MKNPPKTSKKIQSQRKSCKNATETKDGESRSDTLKSDDEIRQKILGIMNEFGIKGYDNSALWTYINLLIALTREACEKEFEEIKKTMEWATTDIKLTEQKRILEKFNELWKQKIFDVDKFREELMKEIEK